MPNPRVDLVDFWIALANPKVTPDDAPAQSLQSEIECGTCGLQFAEFERLGLAGCDACYGAFRGVILPALSEIHKTR